MLLASSTATVGSPTTNDPHSAVLVISSICTYCEPQVATSPKNTKTMSSPRPM